MSQHVYTLKFTISIDKAEDGVYPIHGETREVKHESLTDLLPKEDDATWTKEDEIKAEVEKRIKEVIPTLKGLIRVSLDSLTET